MIDERINGILGLAFRAKQLVPGAQLTLELIRDGKAALVIVDETASPNTKKKVKDACQFYHVPMYQLPQNILGQSLGRTGMATAGIKPGGFAQQASALLSDRKVIYQIKTAEDKG